MSSTDSYTTLSIGSGGSNIDETAVTYGTDPTLRKRSRIVMTGEGISEIVQVLNTAPEGSEYAVAVRQVGNIQTVSAGESIIQFGTVSSVPYNTETTVASYVVSDGQTFYFTGFTSSGNVDAKFLIYLDSTLKMVCRSSAAVPNASIMITTSAPSASSLIELKAIHTYSTIGATFEGTVLGYVI